MSDTLTESAFSDLFINDIPMLDVRAPIEYQRGSFPTATNIPLLNDDERHKIGKYFKAEGQQAAINLGHKLVSGRNKEQRIQQWQEFLQVNPNAVLYCFRGGLRSHTAHQWIQKESGISITRIAGGYKALRRYLIEVIDTVSETSNFMIIGGKTGSGKTHLINALNFSVDLEGLANHRGSAFGRRICPQPTQINFENKLGIALLKLSTAQAAHIFLEDESRAIGSLSIPKIFHDQMKSSPVAVLEEPLETRVDTIYTDYIYSNFQDFVSRKASSAHEKFSNLLLNSLQKIQRRLGGEKHQQICSIMTKALQEGSQQNQEEAEALHKQWIKQLLQDYYDPMYEYQMNKKSNRIIYRGSKEEFLSWASHLNPREI